MPSSSSALSTLCTKKRKEEEEEERPVVYIKQYQEDEPVGEIEEEGRIPNSLGGLDSILD